MGVPIDSRGPSLGIPIPMPTVADGLEAFPYVHLRGHTSDVFNRLQWSRLDDLIRQYDGEQMERQFDFAHRQSVEGDQYELLSSVRGVSKYVAALVLSRTHNPKEAFDAYGQVMSIILGDPEEPSNG